MVKAAPYQPIFNAGELGPRLAARTDFTKYQAGCSVLENMVCLGEGGAMRRPGTRYVAEVKDSNKKGRLKAFEFNTEQAYVIEMADGAFRFFRHQGQIAAAATTAAMTNGTFDTDIVDWHDKSSAPASIAHAVLGSTAYGTFDNTVAHSSLTLGGASANKQHLGVRVPVDVGGPVRSVRIKSGTSHAVDGTVDVGIHADGSSLGTQIGGFSDTVDYNAASTEFTFTWTSNTPVLTAGSVWVVVRDTVGTMSSSFEGVNDQGSSFASGREDTISAIGDGTGSFPTIYDGRLELVVDTDETINGVLALVGSGSNTAHAEQSVTVTDPSAELVLAFRVIGAAHDKIKLRIGMDEEGTQVINDAEYAAGSHTVAFTLGATTFYVQFLHSSGKTIYIDDVVLLNDTPVELWTPYGEADLFEVEGPQSADVLYLFHEDHAPRALQRKGHASWSLVEVDFQDGPWLDENITSTTLTPAATTGDGVEITASAVDGINGGAGFKSTDVGRLVRISNPSSGTDWGWGRIVGFNNPTKVTVDVRRDFARTTADANSKWQLGAWSDTTGWPKRGTFFEQRVVTGRTTQQPQTFWMSETGGFGPASFSMSPDSPTDETTPKWDGTVEDDDAATWTLSSDSVDAIEWFSPGENRLVIGTAGNEWVPESSGAILTPTDIAVRKQTSHGSASVQPIRIGSVVLFLQRAKRKIREFGFRFESDGFKAFDMTRLAKHVTYGGLVEMAYQQEPDSTAWCVRADGQLACMSFNRDEDVVGWSRHVLGGRFGTRDAVVESVATIPGDDGAGQVQDSTDRGEVWVIVKRTINGETKRYVEVLERDFETGHDQDDAYYVDSCVTLDSPVAISGATVASPVVITATAHGCANGDQVKITKVKGMTDLNGNRYLVANATTNTFEITDLDGNNVDGTAFTAYLTGGEVRKMVATVSGLGHLEGETVKVWADGYVHPPVIVSSGKITLDGKAAVVQAGLGYRHMLKTLKLEAGAVTGTAVGKTKKVHAATFVLLNAHTMQVSVDGGAKRKLDFRQMDSSYDFAVPLFSGERFEDLGGNWTRDTRVTIEGDDPAPFTLLAFAPEIRTNEAR